MSASCSMCSQWPKHIQQNCRRWLAHKQPIALSDLSFIGLWTNPTRRRQAFTAWCHNCAVLSQKLCIVKCIASCQQMTTCSPGRLTGISNRSVRQLPPQSKVGEQLRRALLLAEKPGRLLDLWTGAGTKQCNMASCYPQKTLLPVDPTGSFFWLKLQFDSSLASSLLTGWHLWSAKVLRLSCDKTLHATLCVLNGWNLWQHCLYDHFDQ
jgi:hypothetical protein